MVNFTAKEFLCIIIAGVLMLVSHNIDAETTIQLHTFSKHVNNSENYNEVNYGLGLRIKVDEPHLMHDYFTIGVYENSERHTSHYIGIGYEWKVGNVILGIAGGAVSGYTMGNILPYVVPTIRYKKVAFVFHAYPEATVHMTIDIANF